MSRVRRRVCHVSPTYFAAESFIGGGERFVEELAAAMAARGDASVRLVAFGSRPQRDRPATDLERVILRNWTRRKMTPFSPSLFRELRDADVIHCYQYHVFSTFLAAWYGRRTGKPVFVTDLGGGGWTPSYQIDISRWITAQLVLSEYAARGLDGTGLRHRVIYGGVDLHRYPPRDGSQHDGTVLFLGRVRPHKGIHFLIEAMAADRSLDVIGPVSDAGYREQLAALAAGKRVRFHTQLTDQEIVTRLGRAMVLVHPTPTDATGSAAAHELFGLALVEAMACGCPVIASAVASLPEIVEHERSGLLVPPNDPAAIRAAIDRLASDPDLWRRLSRGARVRVEEMFTWDQVVERCYSAYDGATATP